jgi:hypothetical protein
VLAAVVAVCSGCVAVNVGKPQVFKRTNTRTQTIPDPDTLELLEMKARSQIGNRWGDLRLTAWLDGTVSEECTLKVQENVSAFTSRKKMAIGFFPGAAEFVYASSNDLNRVLFHSKTSDGNAMLIESRGEMIGVLSAMTFTLLGSAIATVPSLFVHPFTPWSCSQECYCCTHAGVLSGTEPAAREYQRGWTDPRGSILSGFSGEELRAAHVTLQGEDAIRERHFVPFFFSKNSLSHMGLAGVHKYPVITDIRFEALPWKEAGKERRSRTQRMPGPYEVEFRIPSIGHVEKKRVSAQETEATFVLPQTEHGGTCHAQIAFSWEDGKGLLGQYHQDGKPIAGMVHLTTVELPEKRKPKPVATHTPPPAQAPVREVVKEVHHYHETRVLEERKPEGPPYNVEKTVDGAGRTVWRVTILAENLNAFGVDGEVKPRILQELRDDFAGRNPNVPRGEINAFASYTTENGGRMLVYVGVAESLIPSLESLTFSSETHRGTVTMRLASGAELRRSKEFVRNNISAIVCDKNVVITAGARPPDGAKYRSLDENFADGVLTVEFEAVE